MVSRYLIHKHAESSPTRVRVGTGPDSTVFGGADVPIIAGPCSVESMEQMLDVARTLQALGIRCIRGGIFKPRTSPYSFQGLGRPGAEILGEVRKQCGLSVITEVMSPEQVWDIEPVVDCFQVGSRNMQNFELLKTLGRQGKPVILKRGFAATLEEFLMAAEYILNQGNPNVILCERGIRGFDSETRNVLDLTSVAVLKEKTHLPVIADPSHGTGRRSLVLPASRAAVAVGADGIMVEVHPRPGQSVSDPEQAIGFGDLRVLVDQLHRVAGAVDRRLDCEATPSGVGV